MELVGAYSNHSGTSAKLADLRKRIEERTARRGARRVRRQKTPRRLSAEGIAELVQGYGDGLTVYELASEFGIHRQTVSRALEREGVPRRGRSLSSAQIERAIGLRRSGWSLAQVGTELGCDPSTVWRTLAEIGNTVPQVQRDSDR